MSDWEALHVRCPVGRGRAILLLALASALSTPWGFVDAGDVLELVIPAAAGTVVTAQIVEMFGTEMLLGKVHPVCAFRADVFPGSSVPSVFLEAFVAATPRIVAAIGTAVEASLTGSPRVTDAAVSEQVAAVYSSLIADHGARVNAMAWHGAWLERLIAISDRSARTTSPCVVSSSSSTTTWPELVALRPALESYAASVGASLPARTSGATAVRMLLARLAHGQAVRLWGPEEPRQLRREVAILRSLLSSEPTSST